MYKKTNLIIFSGILLLSLSFSFLSTLIYAEETNLSFFNKDMSAFYDIYYEVSRSIIHSVKNVKIVGSVTIWGQNFLVIKGSNTANKEKEGYILFNTIKAILPSGSVVPNDIWIRKE